MIKEMIYQSKNIICTLDKGSTSGFEYRITSYGTHPCCYIEIPKTHPYFGLSYEKIDIECHYGLTYSESILRTGPDSQKSWWLGWDYAHSGDYAGYYELDCMKGFDHSKDKKWTTAELKEEVIQVIKQLKEID